MADKALAIYFDEISATPSEFGSYTWFEVPQAGMARAAQIRFRLPTVLIERPETWPLSGQFMVLAGKNTGFGEYLFDPVDLLTMTTASVGGSGIEYVIEVDPLYLDELSIGYLNTTPTQRSFNASVRLIF